MGLKDKVAIITGAGQNRKACHAFRSEGTKGGLVDVRETKSNR